MKSTSSGESRVCVLAALNPSNYERHALHSDSVIWQEKNCYTDLWIELLHARGMPPEAMLPFVIDIDFEGDQWTFFKPLHDELYELYGARVNELTVWRPLIDHALEHLKDGRLIITDADAFWLPDTSGTDYRRKHTKTAIVLNDVDLAAQRLGYFHNTGYFVLSGEDFVKTFRLDAGSDPAFLPLYAETASFDCDGRAISLDALRATSRALWRKHLQRTPLANPVQRFAQRFAQELPALQKNGLDHYNAWAFASIRQMGAAFELAAKALHWLGGAGPECPTAAQAFMQIAQDAQAMIFKGARAVVAGRPIDPVAQLASAATGWESGLRALRRHFAVARDAGLLI